MAKQWAWSFSKLKNYETCPKRFNEIDLLRNYKDEDNEQLVWGNRVHAALAAACSGKAPLPKEMDLYQHWVDRVIEGPGKLLVEQKYAITQDMQKTEYFAPNVWYRGIGDVVRIAGPVALVLDWKTGKVDPNSIQLALMAQCIFSHFPEVQRVRSEFVWLQDDCTTPEAYGRRDLADVWYVDGWSRSGGKPALIKRVAALEQAAKDQNYPPKKSYLCRKYCAVISCPYHGK